MEDPTRSRAHPPSRVATTAVTMVTPPKVRSMDSRPTPNSSCPACVHARRMAREFPSCQQACRLWYQNYLTHEHMQHVVKGTSYNVPLQGVVQQCLPNQSPIVNAIGSVMAALSRTLVNAWPMPAEAPQHISHRLRLCTHSWCMHFFHSVSTWLLLMQHILYQGMLGVGQLGTKVETPGDQSRVTWGLKQDHLGPKQGPK